MFLPLPPNVFRIIGVITTRPKNPYTIDGNAVVELTAESTQKIVVDEKNPIIIKIGDAPEIKITDAVTAEKYKITFTDKKIIWDVKEYSKDKNLRISYHVQ